MSKHALADYLLCLAEDPDESTKFRESAESARRCMTAAGLHKEHQDLLLSNNPEKISAALSTAFPVAPGATQIRMSVCFTAPPPEEGN